MNFITWNDSAYAKMGGLSFTPNLWITKDLDSMAISKFSLSISLMLQQLIIFFWHQQPIYAVLGYIHLFCSFKTFAKFSNSQILKSTILFDIFLVSYQKFSRNAGRIELIWVMITSAFWHYGTFKKSLTKNQKNSQ